MHFSAKLRNQLPILSAIVATAVTVSALHGSALIPSSTDGTISGCYRNTGGLLNNKGSLRIVDEEAGATCNGNEALLQWPSQLGNTNSNVSSNRKVIMLNADRENLLTFPELLAVDVGCSSNPGEDGIFVTNLSDEPIYFNESTVIAPQTVLQFDRGNSNPPYLFSQDSTSDVIGITISGFLSETNPVQCRYSAVSMRP